MTSYDTVSILSPHHDDAALGVGGWLAALARERPRALRRWRIINVFTRSVYCPNLPGVVGVDAVSRARAEEDARFASLYDLGVINLGIPDSSCLAMSDEEELKAPAATDPRLMAVAALIRKVFARDGRGVIIAPAAIGSHIDHRLTLMAVKRVLPETFARVYYEDMPYAYELPLRAVEEEARRNVEEPVSQWYVDVTGTMELKLRALRCYPSQLSAREEEAVAGHAARTGGGRLVERFWTACSDGTAEAFLREQGADPF